MKEPSTLIFIIMVLISLIGTIIGLYLLSRLSRLFRGVKNNWVRRNLSVFVILFFMNLALLPIQGDLISAIYKLGWIKAIGVMFSVIALDVLIIYNTARWLANHPRVKRLAPWKYQTIVVLSIILLSVIVHVPCNYILNDFSFKTTKYALLWAVYLGGTVGLVYIVLYYIEEERKRKFDEKELELSRLRELKTKAELDALHSKVNPHFLYNALNSIADLSITDGKKARKMTVALADLFRYSINYSNNNYSTVQEEIEMAEVYLQIEKIRFEDQLTYRIEVDPSANHYLVPRFVLQPVVENAVKHGLKATGKLTDILISVGLSGNTLIIDVADNGPSFPDELNPGYGVKSMYDKLDLLFPGQYEIFFMNAPEKKVSIRINKLIKNEPGV